MSAAARLPSSGMHVAAVHLQHAEVQTIQPTWHCLLRFRQRGRHAAGAEELAETLRATLAEADIARWPPAWAAGQRAPLWAVSDPWAFPLEPLGGGTWAAATCLRKDR